MPIHVTDGAGVATLQAQVTLGSKNISKVYHGSTLKFQGTLTYDLLSDTNVNLETFILSQTAVTSSAIVINIPSGNIIGSTAQGTPAMVTGDLSAYTRGVTLNVIGEIQGAGGTLTLNAGDAFTATSDLTINNTGAIRAGGGGGGAGGLGGYGDDAINKTTPPYVQGYHEWWYGTTPGTSNPSLWYGVAKFTNNQASPVIRFVKTGGDWYYPDGFYGGAAYGMGRGDAVTGVKGAAGAGGIGQGYAQAKADGGGGSAGTYRAGNGGDGGNGGNWGEDGLPGIDGGDGKYYGSYSNQNVASGAGGSAGTLAGYAINSGAATVTLLGAGVVNGDVI